MYFRSVLLVSFSAVAVEAQGPVDLLHISDSHAARLEGVHPDLARARAIHAASLGKLTEFVAAANQRSAAAVVITGDIVDAACFEAPQGPLVHGHIESVARVLAGLRHPYHLVLGNHDVECYRRDPAKPGAAVGDQSVAAEARKRWRRAFPAFPGPAYSRPLGGGYRLVAIDNGQALESRGGRKFFEGQMRWLRKELERYRRERIVLALHIPLAADERSMMVRKVLEGAPQVKLILCGHRHTDGIEWLPLAGHRILQVRTAALYLGAGNVRRVRLWGDRVEVSATGQPEVIAEVAR